MDEKQLDRLLLSIDDPVADTGFTESVLQRLPARRVVSRHFGLLIGACVLSSLPVILLFPFEQLANALMVMSSKPLLVLALALVVSASLSLLGWRLKRGSFGS